MVVDNYFVGEKIFDIVILGSLESVSLAKANAAAC